VSGAPAPADTTAARIRADHERTRTAFDSLVRSLDDESWRAPSLNPAWTNGQLLFHMAFGFILIPPLFAMIGFWSRRSPRASHAFASTLDFFTPAFNRVNALGPRIGALVYGRTRLAGQFDRVHAAILRKVDSVDPAEWPRGMYYPRRWDPTFGEFMTFEELFEYPIAHFERHMRHLAVDSLRSGTSS
jgi:hypothetical protein